MPLGWSQCCFHLNTVVRSLCEFGCISTTLCYGISFDTSLVDTVYDLSSFFTILVHIRCQVCVYEPQMLCLFAIFFTNPCAAKSRCQMYP